MGQRPSLLPLRPTHLAAAITTYSSSRRSFFGASAAAAAMSAELIPSKPDDLMVVRNVTPNIVTFSLPFSRFGKIRIGGRGTLGASRPRPSCRCQTLLTPSAVWQSS